MYRTDGTRAGTILIHSAESISVSQAGGNTFFSSWTSGGKLEFWTTDGTEVGTHLVKNFGPSSSRVSIQEPTDIEGILYFTVHDGIHGWEVWKSDGTADGTHIMKDILPGIRGSDPEHLTNVSGTLYFTARDRQQGLVLWKSDGTEIGTSIVADVPGSTDAIEMFNLTNVEGSLHFVAGEDCCSGYALWTTDGSAAGTVSSQEFPDAQNENFAFDIVDFNGRAVVSAWTPEYGVEIWISRDGADPDADVNGDGLVNADDVDALVRGVRAGLDDGRFDIDNNEIVDSRDVRYMIDTVLCTFPGDANLDGKVDALDLNAVAESWLIPGSWQSGDFDGNGVVDHADLNILGIHWQQGVEMQNDVGRHPRAPLAQQFRSVAETVARPNTVTYADRLRIGRRFRSEVRSEQTDLAIEGPHSTVLALTPSQRFDWVQQRGLPRWIDAKNDTHGQRNSRSHDD